MNEHILDHNLTVVIPVYNEELVIAQAVRDLYENLVKKIPGTKFIVTEDGSADGTKDVLLRLNKEIPFILVSGKGRKGYARAFKDALNLANSEFIFFCDSDGQHDPKDFFKLAKELDGSDVVSGFRPHRSDPFYRGMLSNGYNLLTCLLFGFRARDMDSGFKLIRKSVVDSVKKHETLKSGKYWEMSEFMLKTYLLGFKIRYVPIAHLPRNSAQTTNIYRLSKLPSIINRRLIGLFYLRFKYKATSC